MLMLEVEKESKGTAEACFVQLVASELKNSQDSKGKIESQIKKNLFRSSIKKRK